MKSIYSIVGMKYHNAEKFVAGLRAGEYLRLRREPDNPHDPLAIAVVVGERLVGYLKATEGHPLANEMDSYAPGRDPSAADLCREIPPCRSWITFRASSITMMARSRWSCTVANFVAGAMRRMPNGEPRCYAPANMSKAGAMGAPGGRCCCTGKHIDH